MNPRNLHLQLAIRKIFSQVETALENLEPGQYTAASKCLFNATIGQHVRHIIELFIELDKGYESGTVKYDNRKRHHRIESDKDFAIALLRHISSSMDRANKDLSLEAGYRDESDELITLDTNYYRELAYNLEHTVHHMALIRIGINELSSLEPGENFGIASSTIKYRSTCAQ